MGIEKTVSRLCHDETNRYLRVKDGLCKYFNNVIQCSMNGDSFSFVFLMLNIYFQSCGGLSLC